MKKPFAGGMVNSEGPDLPQGGDYRCATVLDSHQLHLRPFLLLLS